MQCIPVMQSWIFSITTPVTWSFRNHSNMPIYCSRDISYFCQPTLIKYNWQL